MAADCPFEALCQAGVVVQNRCPAALGGLGLGLPDPDAAALAAGLDPLRSIQRQRLPGAGQRQPAPLRENGLSDHFAGDRHPVTFAGGDRLTDTDAAAAASECLMLID